MPKPSSWETVIRPRVTTVMIPRRPRVLTASGRRLFSASLALTRATELPIIRKLRVPSPRPMQAPETEQRHAEGDAGHQGGHADHQHHGDGPAGHVGHVGQGEVSEHGAPRPPARRPERPDGRRAHRYLRTLDHGHAARRPRSPGPARRGGTAGWCPATGRPAYPRPPPATRTTATESPRRQELDGPGAEWRRCAPMRAGTSFGSGGGVGFCHGRAVPRQGVWGVGASRVVPEFTQWFGCSSRP